jgi:ubiquinone biosynthesis accessory factor UbiK
MRVFMGLDGIFDDGRERLVRMANARATRWRRAGFVARVLARSGKQGRNGSRSRFAVRQSGELSWCTKIDHSRNRGTDLTTNAPKLCIKGKIMKQPNDVFNEFQQKMSELLKNSPAKDIERNMKAMLSQGFSKLDLVTREEFDTQTQVLVRTRARLEELEQRVAQLEQRLTAGGTSQD